MNDQKLYIIVRSDLSPGAQCAQACHAMRAFSGQHPERDATWYRDSNNLVVLNVASEGELMQWLEMLQGTGAPVALFREPDFGDQATAFAALPESGRELRKLPLALAA